MNFLEKLDSLMADHGLNRRALSEASGIPYTTIMGFYSKGYEGARMSTIKVLARYFNVSTDYMIRDEITDPNYGFSVPAPSSDLTPDEQKLLEDYRSLNDQGREHIRTCMASAQALFKEKRSDISSLESKSS